MTTERIDIQIREDGSRTVIVNINKIGEAAEKSANPVDMLKKALAGLAAFLAVDKIKQFADGWASASGAIRIATKSLEEADAVQQRLFKSAQDTRQEFGSMVELYTRVARSGKSLGKSQEDILKFSELIGKSLAVQGGPAEAMKGALLQLGQALGSGVVRAEEFNSVLEGAPYILNVVANNIKGVDGDIGKLRKVMLDGKLTSKDFFDAFLKGAGQIGTDFNKSAFTIAQSFTIIENAAMKYIGELDKSLGVSQAIGRAARWIADNFDQLAAGLIAVGAAAAVAFAPAAVTAFTGAVAGLFALVAANPLGAFLIALTAVVAYFTVLRDSVNVGIDDVTTLGDVYRALGESASAAMDVVTEATGTFINWLGAALTSLTNETASATEDWTSSYRGFYDGVGTGFAGIVRGAARTFDAIGGFLLGFDAAARTTFNGFAGTVSYAFRKAYNFAAEWIENMVNASIEGVNKISRFFGKELLSAISLPRADVNEKFFEQYGANISKAFQSGFEFQGGALEKLVVGVFDRAAEIGKERVKNAAKTAADLTVPMGPGSKPGPDEKELKALEKLKNELRSLLNTIDPVNGGILEQAKAFDILRQALGKHLITADQHAAYLERVRQHYKDIIDPMGAFNRELDRETALLGMNAQQREVEVRLNSAVLDLRQKGINLTAAEVEGLRQRFVALQELNRVTQEQDSILAASLGKRQQLADQMRAINALQSNPASGFTQGDAQIATADVARSAGLDIEGTKLAVDAQIAQFQRMYDTIAQLRQQNLIDEQTAAQLRTKVDIQQRALQFSEAQSFFGNLSALSKSQNSKLAAIGKAAAIAQATINTYQAATAAYSSLASIPYVGPALGAAAAAAAIAAGLANVAQIRSANTGFLTGGSFTVPGQTGGADSNMVAFRASPGERVSIQTPTQVRKGTKAATEGGGGQAAPQPVGVRVINVLDPNLLQDYLSTPAGERVFVNTLQRNASAVQGIVNSGG